MLEGEDGAALRLVPSAYEFPAAREEDDANWLVVRGEARAAAGAAWAFSSPCLSTGEAAALGTWLRAAAAGDVAPLPAPADGLWDDTSPGLLTFLEPVLAFSVAAVSGTACTVRAHLSLEAEPPDGLEREPYEYVLRLVVLRAGLLHAAERWEHELAAYPVRLTPPRSRPRRWGRPAGA
ncbi:WapI family immunity protein [Motilibacter aurantiacus]|uniref:WapI family immunity protein n=1 Tax=Motilibacter aurantiacus TaxID=2714955 RepID=UPI001E54C496|nr:hypothetical protein [Motilibacter aurantiacus]